MNFPLKQAEWNHTKIRLNVVMQALDDIKAQQQSFSAVSYQQVQNQNTEVIYCALSL